MKNKSILYRFGLVVLVVLGWLRHFQQKMQA